MTKTFDVSVVVPCFNASQFIGATLRSVLEQTVPVTEVIVVDDGSTDDSAELAESFGPPVTVVRQQNAGESSARNAGIRLARGNWIAFLDSDDVWLPQKLETQRPYCLNGSDVVCCHSWYEFLVGEQRTRRDIPPVLNPPSYSVLNMLLHGMVFPSSAVVRADAVARFPEWTKYGEDMIYFADLAREGRFAFVPTPLVLYRRHERAQSVDPTNILRARDSCLRWLDEFDVLSPEAAFHARAALLNDVDGRARMLRWRREWDRYHLFRSFLLSQRRVNDASTPEMTRRLWPRWMYEVVDRFRGGSGQ